MPSLEDVYDVNEPLLHIGCVVDAMPRDMCQDLLRLLHFADDWDADGDTPLSSIPRHSRKFGTLERAFCARWQAGLNPGKWLTMDESRVPGWYHSAITTGPEPKPVRTGGTAHTVCVTEGLFRGYALVWRTYGGRSDVGLSDVDGKWLALVLDQLFMPYRDLGHAVVFAINGVTFENAFRVYQGLGGTETRASCSHAYTHELLQAGPDLRVRSATHPPATSILSNGRHCNLRRCLTSPVPTTPPRLLRDKTPVQYRDKRPRLAPQPATSLALQSSPRRMQAAKAATGRRSHSQWWRRHQSKHVKKRGYCANGNCPGLQVPTARRRTSRTYYICEDCTAINGRARYLCNDEGGSCHFEVDHGRRMQSPV